MKAKKSGHLYELNMIAKPFNMGQGHFFDFKLFQAIFLLPLLFCLNFNALAQSDISTGIITLDLFAALDLSNDSVQWYRSDAPATTIPANEAVMLLDYGGNRIEGLEPHVGILAFACSGVLESFYVEHDEICYSSPLIDVVTGAFTFSVPLIKSGRVLLVHKRPAQEFRNVASRILDTANAPVDYYYDAPPNYGLPGRAFHGCDEFIFLHFPPGQKIYTKIRDMLEIENLGGGPIPGVGIMNVTVPSFDYVYEGIATVDTTTYHGPLGTRSVITVNPFPKYKHDGSILNPDGGLISYPTINGVPLMFFVETISGIREYSWTTPGPVDASNTTAYYDDAVWGLVKDSNNWGYLQLDIEDRHRGYLPYGEVNLVLKCPDDATGLVTWTGLSLFFSGMNSVAADDGASEFAGFWSRGATAKNKGYASVNGMACLFPKPALTYDNHDPNEFIVCRSAPPPDNKLYERYISPTTDIALIGDIPLNNDDVHYYSKTNRYDNLGPQTAGTELVKTYGLLKDNSGENYYRVPSIRKPPFRYWVYAANNPKDILDNLDPASPHYNTRWKSLKRGAISSNQIVTGGIDGTPGCQRFPVYTGGSPSPKMDLALYDLYGKYLAIKIILYTNSNTAVVTGAQKGNDWPNPASSIYFPWYKGNDLVGADNKWPPPQAGPDLPPINQPWAYFNYNDRTMTPQLGGLEAEYSRRDLNIHLGSFKSSLRKANDGTNYDQWRVKGQAEADFYVTHR